MKKYILFIIFSLPIFSAAADITVEITSIELGDGMAQLESMVNNQMSDASAAVEELISTYTVKPLLFGGMSGANTTTASILPFSLPVITDYAIFTGSAASFTSKTFDLTELTENLSDLAIEEDLYIGAALQGFSVYMTLPADLLIEGLSFTAGGGYLSFDYDIASISSSSLHLSSSYTFFKDDLKNILNWTGLNLQMGFTLSNNTIAVVYPIEFTQTFPFDADGAGPIVPFSVTILLSPNLGITYKNTQFSIPAVLSTGINLLDTLSFNIGAGASVTFGQNSIEIDVDDEISVEGFLSNLIETSPRIVINGSQPGVSAGLLSPFMFAAFSFNAGNFYLNLPLSWDFNNTLTAGITLGAGF